MNLLKTTMLSLFSICFLMALTIEKKYVSNDPSIKIGKQIYTTGIGASDQKIVAQVSGRNMPGSMMACVNCHGKCGKAVVLQGVDIPDIRKQKYIERHLSGQAGLEAEKLADNKMIQAITMGRRHDGEEIHRLMPRYQMSLVDMEHLLNYLSYLGIDENCNKE